MSEYLNFSKIYGASGPNSVSTSQVFHPHVSKYTPPNPFQYMESSNVCQICHHSGHLADICRHRTNLAYNARYHPSQPQYSTPTHPYAPSQHSNMAPVSFVLDSGATNHMTSSSEIMSQHTPYQGNDSVTIANGSSLPVTHIGQSILLHGNRSFNLRNMLCVPQMHKNLLSIRKFSLDNNCFFELDGFGFRVKDNQTRKIVLSGSSSGGLYNLSFTPTPKINPLALIGERATSSTWHARLGHPSSQALSAGLRILNWMLEKARKIPGTAHSNTFVWSSIQMGTLMETHASSWYNVECVPGNYIFPLEERPGKLVPLCDSIPVIDLGNPEEQSCTAHQILEAAQEFGFFQVVNHEIPENIIIDTARVLREFFDMASKDKASVAPNTKGWMYGSSNAFAKNGVHLWRDNIKQSCHPLEERMQLWPEKPTAYREVVATYLVEIGKLSVRILELIGEGLGLEAGYLNEKSEVQLMTVNNYPPCPDPSLTLGLLRHNDPSLITILFQSTSGLQVLKDGEWIGVGALPNAFVVNVGNQLEIISNGKLKSAEHRAVTNSSEVRTSIATFISPKPDCIVEPAKVLVNELNPPRFKSSLYKDFVCSSKGFGAGSEKDELDPAILKLIR